MAVQWNQEKTLYLIEKYKENQILWNPSHPNHYNRMKKLVVWDDIAKEMQIDVIEIRKKMTALLATMRSERSRMKRSNGSGRPYVSQWFGFPAMKFLSERQMKRIQLNTEVEPAEDSDTEETPCSTSKIQKQESEKKLKTQRLIEPPFSLEQITEPEKDNEPDPKVTLLTPKIEMEPDVLNMEPDVLNMEPDSEFKSEPIEGRQLEDQMSDPLNIDYLKEECDCYGMYLAHKLRAYSSLTRSHVMYNISSILFKADLGEFEKNN